MANVLFTWIAKYEYTKDWGVREHTHTYYQIYYVTGGKGKAILDDRRVDLKPGVFLLFKPGQRHGVLKMRQDSFKMFDMTFTLPQDSELHQLLCAEASMKIIDSDDLRDQFDRMRNIWKSQYPYRLELCNCMVEELLYRYIQDLDIDTDADSMDAKEHSFTLKPFTGVCEKVDRYLQEHYAYDVTLDDLAAAVNYSKNYLCKVFKRTTGYTINEYLTILRIHKATQLLCHSDMKIMDIGMQVGFKSLQHFSRVYKKIQGYAPKEMREHEKEGLYSDILGHGAFSYRYYEK